MKCACGTQSGTNCGLSRYKIQQQRDQWTLEYSYTRRKAAPVKLLLASRRSVSSVSGLSASRGPLAPSALKFRDATRPSAEQVTPSQLERANPVLQAASPAQVSSGLRLYAGTCAVTGQVLTGLQFLMPRNDEAACQRRYLESPQGL